MNVVGKVGSLISQGVYSVATPFHPFGGAVDVIVVQQQDGTFRSTPWYVRFGKFQGVLKGAEKIVRINVNGVEADFHMYLDNSGEAYFVREVESGKGSETNGDGLEVLIEDHSIDSSRNSVVQISRHEHSVSDSMVTQLQEHDSSGLDRLNRAESDVDRRYYDFQDEQSSIDGSVELSEFGSNRYEGIDVDHGVEQHGLDSEVILVSVDGHVLTAPISASEGNTENVLSTPQFHLGPGEANEDFHSGDDGWAADYISKLNSTVSSISSDNTSCMDNDAADLDLRIEICEGDAEHVCRTWESESVSLLDGDNQAQSDSEDASHINKRKEIFKSCLELSQLDELQVTHVGSEDIVSPVEVQNAESPHISPSVSHIDNGGLVEFTKNGSSPPSDGDSVRLNESGSMQIEVEATEASDLGTERISPESMSAHSVVANDSEQKDDNLCTSTETEGLDHTQLRPMPEDHDSGNESLEPRSADSSGEMQASSSLRFEISLCGKELHAGMGLEAATNAFEMHRVSAEEFRNSAESIIKNESLIVRCRGSYLQWEKAAPIVLGRAAFDLDLPVDPKAAIPVEVEGTPDSRDDDAGTSMSFSRRWRLWPPFRRVKTMEHTSSNSSSEELFVDTECGVQNSITESGSTVNAVTESPRKQLIRTNVPTSEQIASLNLKDGQNMVTFSFSTRVLGSQKVEAHIYLWKWNARIVISDVDGTITKSDVLGQFMPLVGKDWTQSGVARLFSAIKENGYQLLFLSARAIVQAYLTRSFLSNLKQDGKNLPNGPIVISPDGLFPALFREVVRRAPHEFKIACLEDIRKLFPPDYNPFYAGFGNRDTDELSYRKIGIPKGKIFIINPKGEVAISHRIDVKSYTSLHTLVNDMFPPPTSLVEQEDYNSWNFWKVAIPDIEL